MKMEIKNNKIYTYTPYNKNFIQAARRLGGRWDSSEKAWVFPCDIEEEVRNTLTDFYGYGIEKVDVKLTCAGESHRIWNNKEIVIWGRTILRRKNRDYTVTPDSNVSILKGGFDESGGSRANPQVGYPQKGTELLVRNVPKNLLHEIDTDEFDVEIIDKKKKSAYLDFTIEQLQDMKKDIEAEIRRRNG